MRTQRGLSLIELMVAMVIGLIISGVVLQVFISNKNTFLVQNATGHLQENGRFALQYLAAEMRPAGVGMGVRLAEESICVVGTNGAASEWNAMNRPIWAQRITAEGALGAVGTDQISLFVNDNCGAFLTEGEILKPAANANIKVTGYCPSMQQNRAVMVMDLEKATQVMLHVHTRGRGVCGVFTREIAESKVAQVNEYSRLNQHPLLCTMERA